MPDQKRSLLRLGALQLLFAAAFGIAAAIPLPNPARWMTAHLTLIINGTLTMVLGMLWRDLRLSDTQRSWMINSIYISVWAGLAFGVAAAVMDIPGPATSPGITMTGPQAAVTGILLTLIVPTTILSWALLFLGLRGNDERS